MNSLALDLYLDIQKDKLAEVDRVNNRIYDILSVCPSLESIRTEWFQGLEKRSLKYQTEIATYERINANVH